MAALKFEGEFLVIDAKVVKHRRVEIVDVNRILRHVVKEILLVTNQAKLFQLVIALRLRVATGRGRRCERGQAANRSRQKQKAKSAAKRAEHAGLRRAGSTTDGKDVRRDHTLRTSHAISAPQSFPILWWLGAKYPAVNQPSNNEAAQSTNNEDRRIRLGDDRIRQAEQQAEKQADGPAWPRHFHTSDDQADAKTADERAQKRGRLVWK